MFKIKSNVVQKINQTLVQNKSKKKKGLRITPIFPEINQTV
jgi:hypothetical protein